MQPCGALRAGDLDGDTTERQGYRVDVAQMESNGNEEAGIVKTKQTLPKSCCYVKGETT